MGHCLEQEDWSVHIISATTKSEMGEIYRNSGAGKERAAKKMAVNSYVPGNINARLDTRSLSVHGG